MCTSLKNITIYNTNSIHANVFFFKSEIIVPPPRAFYLSGIHYSPLIQNQISNPYPVIVIIKLLQKIVFPPIKKRFDKIKIKFRKSLLEQFDMTHAHT